MLTAEITGALLQYEPDGNVVRFWVEERLVYGAKAKDVDAHFGFLRIDDGRNTLSIYRDWLQKALIIEVRNEGHKPLKFAVPPDKAQIFEHWGYKFLEAWQQREPNGG